ncbi:MAG TPA: response regulator, partial [Caldithrix abyssi]|nr:response regulator [Caldithrix abyssi]
EALNQFEYAAHSLKSAAKMLGFREIAQVTDSMEQMIEAIKNGEIQNSDQIENALGQGIEAVKKLSSGEKVSSSHLSHIINILELAEPEILQEEEIPTEEPEETTETAKPEVAAYFIEEANELLTGLNMDLLELEKMPQSETLLSNILRNLHTLKGSSLMLKYERIGELCHRLEDYFEFYKTHRTKGDPEMLAPAFVVLDLVEELLNNLKEGNGETADQYTARLAEIDNKLFLYQNFDQQEEIKTPPKKKRGRPKKTATAAKSEDDNVIKISTGYLDNLVNMASELVVSRTEMASYFENLKEILAEVEQEKKLLNQAEDIVEDILEEQEYEKDTPEQETKEVQPEEEKRLRDVSSSFKQIMGRISVLSSELQRLSQDFEKNLSRISSISNALHSDILKVRMVPIENLFNRFPRPVRDMAREQNKKINLVIEGNETEMDRAMVEALADPLMHIVRNAVDHGIETSEERKKQGKSAAGTITLRARQDKNQVVIEVEDDGAGIDLEKIKKSIQKRKLATPAAIKKMNEAELLDFLFYPEFTTREEADKTSGRGIGLDVVANQIQKLKGNIRIRTEKNEGTTFSIRVPLTLVISQALMTKIRDQIVAIPIIAVQESVHIETQSILVEDERQYLQVRGKLLPFVPITQVLKFGDTADEPELNTALILYDAGVSIALGIPEILGRQEIVIKTLGGHLQNVEYIAGGTILGNGEVALILDYAAVIRTTEQQFFGKVSETGTKRKKGKAGTKKTAAKKRSVKQDFLSKRKVTRKKITNRKPRILIVDDSSSVRNFVGGVLEKKNFATLKVNDGQSAIDLLDSENVDLIITDLEMPNMHGFELISLIRQKEQFKDLPIVILTGKTGRGEQKKGAELGADAFIGKPFKESDLLDVITRFIDTGSKK